MPVNFEEIGVQSIASTLVEEFEITKRLEHKIFKTELGAFEQGNKYDPMFEYTVRGRGVSSEALGTGGTEPDQLSGGTTIITSIRHTQSNEDFDSFEFTAVNYPGTV